jgi:hypothetical protein
LVLGLWLLVMVGGPATIASAQPLAVNALSLSQSANDVVWDTTRSRFFASVGTNVLIINPETAQVENTIPIGNRADQIAVSADGQYLYVSIDNAVFPYSSLGTINRYQIQSQFLDLQISLGEQYRRQHAQVCASAAGPSGRALFALSVDRGWPTDCLRRRGRAR